MRALTRSALTGLVAISLLLPGSMVRADASLSWVPTVLHVMNLVYCIVGVGPCPEVFDPTSCEDGDVVAHVDGIWTCGSAWDLELQGPAGAQGVMGPQGQQGDQGPQGPGGLPGVAGASGEPGVGVASVEVNGDGDLVVNYTDGSSSTSEGFSAIVAENLAQAATIATLETKVSELEGVIAAAGLPADALNGDVLGLNPVTEGDCAAEDEGAVRWLDGALRACDGASWRVVATLGMGGAAPSCDTSNHGQMQIVEGQVMMCGDQGTGDGTASAWMYVPLSPDPVSLANECLGTPGPCAANADCLDTYTSYQCTCKAGYVGDGATCVVDPCTASPCDANAVCTSAADGSHSCACNTGYVGDGVTCAIDYCLSATCDPNATCTNGSISYICDCNAGYVGDGATCGLAPVPVNCSGAGNLCAESSGQTSSEWLGHSSAQYRAAFKVGPGSALIGVSPTKVEFEVKRTGLSGSAHAPCKFQIWQSPYAAESDLVYENQFVCSDRIDTSFAWVDLWGAGSYTLKEGDYVALASDGGTTNKLTVRVSQQVDTYDGSHTIGAFSGYWGVSGSPNPYPIDWKDLNAPLNNQQITDINFKVYGTELGSGGGETGGEGGVEADPIPNPAFDGTDQGCAGQQDSNTNLGFSWFCNGSGSGTQYVDIASKWNTSQMAEYTYSFWLYQTYHGSNQIWFDDTNFTGANYGVACRNDQGNIECGEFNGGNDYWWISASGEATTNTWTHYILTRDSTGAYLYKDNALIGSDTSFNGSVSQESSYTPRLFWAADGNDYKLGGYMDQFIIYDKALSSAERGALSVAGGDATPDPDGMIVHYDFEDLSTTLTNLAPIAGGGSSGEAGSGGTPQPQTFAPVGQPQFESYGMWDCSPNDNCWAPGGWMMPVNGEEWRIGIRVQSESDGTQLNQARFMLKKFSSWDACAKVKVFDSSTPPNVLATGTYNGKFEICGSDLTDSFAWYDFEFDGFVLHAGDVVAVEAQGQTSGSWGSNLLSIPYINSAWTPETDDFDTGEWTHSVYPTNSFVDWNCPGYCYAHAIKLVGTAAP